jgi:cytochrome b involved in lipid metabolism
MPNMQPKPIILSIIGILVLAGGLWFYSNWSNYAPDVYVTEQKTATSTETVTVDTKNDTETPGSPSFSQAQVAEHNSASSCYTIISGSVYDLTMWVNMHPGGKAAILSLCGIDGTQKFMAQHHGAQKQMDILARFKIGTAH